jgi:hypothetical protein
VKPKLTIRNCTFAYRCKANWDDLVKDEEDNSIRFCLDCQKEVHFCESDEELVHNVVNNRCIAIIREEHGKINRLLGDVIFNG